jgi:hypothetical protein
LRQIVPLPGLVPGKGRTKPISGDVAYDPEPLVPPASGNPLICGSTPRGDAVLDL